MPPGRPSFIMLCSPDLDRRALEFRGFLKRDPTLDRPGLEFPGFIGAAGRFGCRDLRARLGPCIRSRRGSGCYIDVGASQLIIDGKIKRKRGQVASIDETGVNLDDGTHLDADLIVYATGYNSMNGWVADLMGQEMADRLGKCWGLGSDTPKDPGPWGGEHRNMWMPNNVPNLWMHGGNLHQSRHYSQFLAMRLKARMEGIPTPVYALQGVHHTA
jgi:hypothetical protein